MTISAVLKVVTFQGIEIQVDRPVGFVQQGTDDQGNAWTRVYKNDYGFIAGTEGGDDEALDVFIGPDVSATEAFWIVQRKSDGSFDELKLMLGFIAEPDAKQAWLDHVPAKYFGAISGTSVATIQALLGLPPEAKSAAIAAHRAFLRHFYRSLFATFKDKDMPDAARQAAQASASAVAGSAVSRPSSLCVREALVSAVREDAREIDFICSTESIDSYDEIVRQNWDLKRFANNPVALWSHQSKELPVGHWLRMRVEDGALRGSLKFATAAANPFAENVWQSYLEKNLRAVSVGFMPHKISFEEIDGVERCVLDENELYECSPTPIPANADALVDQKMRAKAAFLVRRAAAKPAELGAVSYEEAPPVDTGKWHAGNVIKRLRRWASTDGSGSPNHIDWNKYKRAFGWYDPKRAHELGGYKLPHHDIRDGKFVTVRGGVIAAGDAVQGSRGGVKIPEPDIAAVRAHLAKHYRQFNITPPWEASKAPAPAGATNKDSPIMANRDDGGEDEMSMTCPHCGEDFKPDDEKSKKALASVREKATAAANARVEPVRTELATVKSALTTAYTERDTALTNLATSEKARVDLAAKVTELEILPLIGVKILPAEKEGLVAIAGAFAGQPGGDVKWKSHMAAINSRPDLKLLGGPITPADPALPTTTLGADAGDEAAALVNAAAR